MKKILVTGGLGFVGSHLVDSLANKGHQVTVIDNLCSESSSKKYMREDVTYWLDDINNLNTYRYEKGDFDLIYHLAAIARIQPSFKDPLRYLKADTMGTASVLEYARRKNSKVVYAGSSSAFAGPMLSPYAFAKYSGEQICELYHKVYGMSVVIARFFNVYGERQPTTGDYATVVGVFQGQKLLGKKLTITGTGEQRRDFTHVYDIVSGFESLGHGKFSAEVYQLGAGKNYSINELAKMFKSEFVYIDGRPGEALVTLADNSKARKDLNWEPKEKLENYVKIWLENNDSNFKKGN